MIKTILISRQVLRLYLITLFKNFKKHFLEISHLENVDNDVL